MADKRCDNGHFIDESWDICPYCPQDASEPEIPVVRPRAVESRPATSPGSPSSATGTFEPVARRDDTASVPRPSMSSASAAAVL
ncbi:MAG TPA: hypothetical protein VE010_21905, partial [Thermoanaerobaculia bacterium]|nr:hypothetical protein [Thermoanaerobaculia bacterium]